MLYFAYGSNLNKVQMQKRCPDSVPIAKVKLKEFKLVFNRVADIIENKGEVVEGAVYDVSVRDIRNLDAYEGYPRLYKKLNVLVQDNQGKTYEAFVYVMVTKGLASPAKHYFDIIAEGYGDWGLPIHKLNKARILEA